MAKLYYGNGNCSIDDEGAEIMGIQITYRGMIELTDQTSDSFFIGHKNNKIITIQKNEVDAEEFEKFVNSKYYKKPFKKPTKTTILEIKK